MSTKNQNQNPLPPAKPDDGAISESDLEAVAGGNKGLIGRAGGKAAMKVSDGPTVGDPSLSPSQQAAAAAAAGGGSPASGPPRPA